MSESNSNTSTPQSFLSWLGFRVMGAWLSQFISELWSSFVASFTQTVWVETKNNVDMLCDNAPSSAVTLGTWSVTTGGETVTSDQVDGANKTVTYSATTIYCAEGYMRRGSKVICDQTETVSETPSE